MNEIRWDYFVVYCLSEPHHSAAEELLCPHAADGSTTVICLTGPVVLRM